MIARSLEAFVGAVIRRPALAALAALAVTAIALASASRLELADDARALVAEGDPEVARQLEALSEFTTVDNLLVHLDSRGHPAELEPAAEALARTLRESDAFTDVRAEVDTSVQLGMLEALMPRRLLLDPRAPAALLAPAALDATLEQTRAELLSPQGIVGKRFLLRDPLGSLRAALGGLSTAPGLSKLDASSGRLLSRDGESRLVVTVPRGNPFSGHDAERTMAAVDAARARVAVVAPHVVVRTIGAHRFARDAEGIVRHDVHVNALMSVAVVLAIFFAFFRRVRLVVVALPPLAFGAAVAFGLAGALGKPVHGIVLAFAAACLGLAIDYTIHLVASVASEGTDTRTALPRAVRKIGRSLTLAMATTVAGLLALALSQVPALREMAILSLGAVVGSFAGTLVWVPIVLPYLAPTTPVPPLLAGPWSWLARLGAARPLAVTVAAGLLLAALVGLSTGTRIDGDLRNLDTHTEEALADEAAFSRAFGDPAGTGLAVVEGKDLDTALARARAVEERLAQAGVARVLSLTSVAPPRAVAAERRARWCAEPWAERLAAAAVARGFKVEAFAAFAGDLESLCGAGGEALLDQTAAIAAFEQMVGRTLTRVQPDGAVRLAVAFEADGAVLTKARAALAELGVGVVHRAELTASLVHLVAADLPRLGLVSFGLVLVLVLAGLRRVRPALAALAPCGLAVATTLGVFALTGTPLNLMNLAVFPLVFGAGIDYGVVVADAAPGSRQVLAERAFGVTVAALTTLAGFGTLALARYYAIATIGQAVLLGIGSAAVYALVVTPAVQGLRRRPAEERRRAAA